MNNNLKNSHKYRIILLGVLFLVNLLSFYSPGIPGSIPNVIQCNISLTNIPDISINYSTSDLFSFLNCIGPEGRFNYQIMHLTIDLTFPLIYGFFFFELSRHLIMKMNIRHKLILMIGFLASIFDFLENFSLIYISKKYPVRLEGIAGAVKYFTITKFTFISLSILLVIVLSAVYFTQKQQV